MEKYNPVEAFEIFERWHQKNQVVQPDQFHVISRKYSTGQADVYMVGDTAFYVSDFNDAKLVNAKLRSVQYDHLSVKVNGQTWRLNTVH